MRVILEFKINAERHLKQSSQILIHVLMAFVIPYFGTWQYGDEGFRFGVKFSIFYISFISLVLLVVHRQYWLVNKSNKLVYSSTDQRFRLLGPNLDIEFQPKDIEKRTINISRAVAGKGMWYFPWDGYIFENIDLKNGVKFTITSLLLPELNWPCELPKGNVKIDLLRWPKNA